MRIALFATCIGDAFFPEAAQATVDVLERLGHDVVFPYEQTCCGQMHPTIAYHADARRLARRFVSVFAAYDAAVKQLQMTIADKPPRMRPMDSQMATLSTLPG